MPRKPKIIKDSDNLAIRFAGMQELLSGAGLLTAGEAKKIADGIRSLKAERDSLRVLVCTAHRHGYREAESGTAGNETVSPTPESDAWEKFQNKNKEVLGCR